MPPQPNQPIPLGPNGTCKIYYNCPNHTNSHFPKPANIKEIHNVEFRFHLTKDIIPKNPLPSTADFEKTCPIFHFVKDEDENLAQNITVTILLTCDGTGKVPRDYERGLHLLHGVMCDLRNNEFEHVVVKLGLGYHADERWALMEEFEEVMGEAIVMDGKEGRCMEFCPREYQKEWLEREMEERVLYPWMD